MRDISLQDKFKFLLVIFAAGTTWFVIPPQIALVGPEFAISYRVLLAGLILIAFALYKKIPFPPLTLKNLLAYTLGGMFLYSLNYLMIYKAILHLPSGLCSLMLAAMIIPNALFGRLILKNPLKPQVLIGAVVSLVGLALLFPDSIEALSLSQENPDKQPIIGYVAIVSSLFFASFGTVMSSKFIKEGLDIYWSTGLAMMLGGLLNFANGLYQHHEILWSSSWTFLSLLLYISVFGSAIVFIAYMKLVNKFGAANASYVWILSPMIALYLSSLFEGMVWTKDRIFGTLIILAGSLIALKTKNQKSLKPQTT